MRRNQASRFPRKAIGKIKRMLAETGRQGKLRPVAFENGEPIGWVGEQAPDECPCCLLVAREEETAQPGTRPRLCRRCGQTIWLHPKDLRRKEKPLCYRCYMGMKPKSGESAAVH